MSKCCEKPNRQLIQDGVGISAGESGGQCRNSVTICLNCGRFQVFSEVNGESQTINFKVWRDDYIEAALVPINEVEESEGREGFIIIRKSELENEQNQKAELVAEVHQLRANISYLRGVVRSVPQDIEDYKDIEVVNPVTGETKIVTIPK